MQSIARGFTGSQLLVQMGSVYPNGPGVAVYQHWDGLGAGTFNVSVSTNDAAFPNPQIALYRVPSGSDPELWDNWIEIANVTGSGGNASASGSVSAGDTIIAATVGVPAGFKGVNANYLGTAPSQLAAPTITVGPGPSKQLTLAGPAGASLFYRTSSSNPWTPYYYPVNLGPFAFGVQAMATKDGWTSSPTAQKINI